MKKDNKFKITKAELQQIIKEEYDSMSKDALRAKKIQERIKTIDKELKNLPKTLSEVDAGSLKGVKSTGWTGAGEKDKKYDEKFEKIGSHLKEMDEMDEMEMDEMEMDEMEMDEMEMNEMEISEMGEEEEMEYSKTGYFEEKFSEIGKEIDLKMGDKNKDEELEVDDVELEVDSDDDEIEEMVSEDLNEPIEGKTLAQDSDARFNDYMEKDKHVKEGVQKGTNLLSEGKTPTQKRALDKELERMKILARINK